MTHNCHAIGCETPVSPRLLMCLRHWRMVPKHLQEDVWRHYRPGQEVTKNPTARYCLAQVRAVNAVALAEGRITAELAASREAFVAAEVQ